ncbi:hypothetical protein Psyaliredsea_03310 [Psychrobacter alimentarius]
MIGVVPFSDSLSVPRTWDIATELDAKWLNVGEAKTRRINRISLTARSVARVDEVFKRGTLIVVPGDRDDLLLAAGLACINGIPLAGLVLTGGVEPSATVAELWQSALKTGIPVMSVEDDSYETVQSLVHMSSEIPSDDTERAEEVARYVAAHLNLDWIKEYFSRDYERRLSPSAFRHQVVKKHKRLKNVSSCQKGLSRALSRPPVSVRVAVSPIVCYLQSVATLNKWPKIVIWSFQKG